IRKGEVNVQVLTPQSIANVFYKSNKKVYDVIIPNTYLLPHQGESDLLCIRPSLFIDEIEIKISKSDYLADFDKEVMFKDDNYLRVNKHKAAADGLLGCNRHYFLMPIELAEQIEVPNHCGLLGVTSGRWIRTIKSAPMLHKRKATLEMIYRASAAASSKYWNLTESLLD
ncbi:hypothetical protein, partial [Yersinia aldovae]|uniref:hypothetical protein n=1 Tax=Yersinia aldovae TaxID=29483 RepID=UPI0016439966